MNLFYIISFKEESVYNSVGPLENNSGRGFWVNMTPLLLSVKNEWLLGRMIIQNIVTKATRHLVLKYLCFSSM